MPEAATNSLTPLLGRIFWILIGPMLLVVNLYYILMAGAGWATPADLAFFLILAAMLLARWVEFRGGNPRRSDGEPATAADLRRYAGLLAVAGTAVWLIANGIGNHLIHG